MANVVIDIAAQYTGNKAFKQAESATAKLEKSVAKLGKQLISVFAAGKLLSFGKSAAKAFAADEKAARSLSLALANTGNAFRGIEVEKFIGDLQRATGVLDDNLRPAFRTLLTATGDVTKSQEGLKLALDIAAGTGKDLGAVSMALAKAYGGQTTALSRLGAGLSKATLASGDLDLITAELTKKFSGQALAAAEGYSGQLDRLAVAAENSKEIIGKGLLDSLALLSGPDGISKSTRQMEDLATAIADTVYGLAILIDKLQGGRIGKAIFGTFGDVLSNLQPFASLRKLGSSSRATPAQSPGERKQIDKINADALRLQKQQNILKKIDNDNTARKITLTADQQALEELKKKFDVERVGLFAALNQATDEETKMRLKSLIAIKDNDAALAGKIKAELEATRAVDFLSSALFRLSAEFDMERARMAFGKAEVAGKVAAMSGAGMSGISPIASSQAALDAALKLYPDFGTEMDVARSAAARGQTNITINATGIGDQQIASVVQNAIQDLNRYGSSTTYAGAI